MDRKTPNDLPVARIKEVLPLVRLLQDAMGCAFPKMQFLFALMAIGVIFANNTANDIVNDQLRDWCIMVTTADAFSNAFEILNTFGVRFGVVTKYTTVTCGRKVEQHTKTYVVFQGVELFEFIVIDSVDRWMTTYWCKKFHTFVATLPRLDSSKVITPGAPQTPFIIDAPGFKTHNANFRSASKDSILLWWKNFCLLIENHVPMRLNTTPITLQFETSSTRCTGCGNTKRLCCSVSVFNQPNHVGQFCGECVLTALLSWYKPTHVQIRHPKPDMENLFRLMAEPYVSPRFAGVSWHALFGGLLRR